MFPILKRKQAAEQGLKRYYTGRPCSKGHEAQRFTSTGVCVKCAAGYVKQYNSRLKRETSAVAAGLFTYPTHPDNVAALLAYAQALDLAMGRVPHIPPVTPKPPSFQDIAAMRRRAYGITVDHTARVNPETDAREQAELNRKAIDEHNAYVAARFGNRT